MEPRLKEIVKNNWEKKVAKNISSFAKNQLSDKIAPKLAGMFAQEPSISIQSLTVLGLYLNLVSFFYSETIWGLKAGRLLTGYYMVCAVNFDLLCVVRMIFVGRVKSIRISTD